MDEENGSLRAKRIFVRFDDMLATVLRQPTPDNRSVGLQWRQLVDLLAQRVAATPSAIVERAYETLIGNRARLTVGERMEAARALAGQRLAPRLVALFADDHAAVAAPVIRSARLDEAAWITLLPALGPTARALLRHRSDLEPAVRRALEGFGAADLVLENALGPLPEAPPEAVRSGSQIRDLVERIEAFQQTRDAKPNRSVGDVEHPPAEFRWECGVDGVLSWSEGGARGAYIGLSIAHSDAGSVDAGIAAAFAGRAGFRNGRLVLANGEWRMSGVPLFDGASGRFLGFRGTGRAVPAEAKAKPDAGGLMGTALPTAALREMVHELRTPLNAIIGFAEMIDGQYLGPAGQRQRERAGDIRDQANRLVRALEDLDLAAKLDAKFDARAKDGMSRDGDEKAARGSVDLAALVVRLHDAFETMATTRGVALAIEIVSDLPPATMDGDAAERLITRLLHASIGVAGAGETVLVRLLQGPRGRDLVLSIDRPLTIRGPGAAAMLDPGYAPTVEVGGAPALGLGFTLRLIRNLARSAGGDLAVEADAFLLSLPSRARADMPHDQRR